MHFILATIICLLITFLFWFIGHTIRKELKIDEENKLLANLINIALGASAFLIVINLIGSILKDFNWALIAILIAIVGLILWQFKEFKQICISLKEFFRKGNLSKFLKENTDRYFWILVGVINFIYGLTAFSTTKLDRFGLPNGHVFNINQLLSGNYPPKYSFLPNVAQKYHYGSDILGGIISKFSGCHPEIALDLLIMLFLNLALLAIYALTVKFLNTNKINKYLVPFAAFLAWGPITNLFKKDPTETIPKAFLEKINYLTQSRLNDSADWSGLVLHWFFAPPIGIGVFFFLIAIYLLFRFFEGERNLKFVILLGIFLSSFVIIDFSKFVILIFGVLIYLFFSRQIEEAINNKETVFLKSLGILFAISIILGFIHGNWLASGKNYEPLLSFFKLGTSNLDKKFSPINSNLLLLVVYIIGFIQAYRLKEKWISFLIPYFIAALILPYLITVPNAGLGKIIMAGNFMGVFAIPSCLDFVLKKINLKKEIQIKAFYGIFIFVICFSTLMFWVFGDREKANFRLEANNLKYTGAQTFPTIEVTKKLDPQHEEYTFVEYLKSKKINDQSIVAEASYAETFSSYAFLSNLLPAKDIPDIPVKKNNTNQGDHNYRTSFLLNDKFWLEHNIHWLYITPTVSKFIIPPQSRMKLLDAYLSNGVKLALSNNKLDNLLSLKELYEVDPKSLSKKLIANKSELIEKLVSSNDTPWFIKQIALCPYYGIYNAMSNDFDGDKIADIAFFDEVNKRWFIVSGKDQKETEINLRENILRDSKDDDLFIPVPSDYDGDSKTDIALFNRNNAHWYIFRSSDSQVEDRSWGGLWGQIPLAADIDGDKRTDNVAYTPDNPSNWGAILSTTQQVHNLNFPSTILDIPAYSDIDGDQKADCVIYRPQENSFYVYLSSKSYSKEQYIKLTIGEPSSRVILADYDGDNKVDLAAWSPQTGKWEIALAKDLLSGSINNTPALFIGCGVPQNPNTNIESKKCAIQTYTLGKPGDIAIPGDYNGDGKDEIAVYHPDNAELEIMFDNKTLKKINLLKYRQYFLASILGV